MATKYDILPLWDHPTSFDSNANFVGYKPTGYVIYSRNRDSSILENVNFNGILSAIGGEGEHVEIVRHKHWACGWIEYIVVNKQAPTALLDQCVDIVKSLAGYPIFCEDSYMTAQNEAIQDHWLNLTLRDRIDVCLDNGVTIFAARRASIPEAAYKSLSADIY